MQLQRISIVLIVLFAATACTSNRPVTADNSTLGRVIVYRNGIAYFERVATATDKQLHLHVPEAKVDDLLKSLTVSELKSGRRLGVSYPTRAATGDGQVDVAVQLGAEASETVKLTYVSEAPAWKPSYRVTLGENGRVDMEGWAIVDNASGEDWRQIQVGVGASSALSFKYDLHSVRAVARETLAGDTTFAKAPPKGGSLYADAVAEPTDGKVVGELTLHDVEHLGPTSDVASALFETHAGNLFAEDDADGGGSRGMGFRGAGNGGGGVTMPEIAGIEVAHLGIANGRHAKAAKNRGARIESPLAQVLVQPVAAPPPPPPDLSALVNQLRASTGLATVEGFATTSESEPHNRALDRANALRNHLIDAGIAPARLRVVARGVVPGQGAGARVLAETAPDNAVAAQPKQPVGETHFAAEGPMTIANGSSAMVSLFRQLAAGAVVYLYDSETARGDKDFAFRAVRFQNPTPSTLETGPLTVYGPTGFIGEGLAEPIPPKAEAVVPFALDRQISVQGENQMADRIDRMLRLNRGLLTAEVQHVRTRKLRMTNRLGAPVEVLVRHTVQPGWETRVAPKEALRFGDARLYAVKLGAGETKDVVIEDATPLEKSLDLRTGDGLTTLRTWLDVAGGNPQVSEKLHEVLQLSDDVVKVQEGLDGAREKQQEYRARGDELSQQLVDLRRVKNAGALMQHLQEKLRETSESLQMATRELADGQDELLLKRAKFRNAVGELTLGGKLAQK
jgi:hypothetical protein